MVTSSSVVLTHPTDGFAYQEGGGGGQDDNEPMVPRERGDVEHLTPKLNDENLTEEDDGDDGEESLAAAQVEGAAVGEERTGIEDVPKLQHHERREEDALFLGAEAIAFEIP